MPRFNCFAFSLLLTQLLGFYFISSRSSPATVTKYSRDSRPAIAGNNDNGVPLLPSAVSVPIPFIGESDGGYADSEATPCNQLSLVHVRSEPRDTHSAWPWKWKRIVEDQERRGGLMEYVEEDGVHLPIRQFSDRSKRTLKRVAPLPEERLLDLMLKVGTVPNAFHIGVPPTLMKRDQHDPRSQQSRIYPPRRMKDWNDVIVKVDHPLKLSTGNKAARSPVLPPVYTVAVDPVAVEYELNPPAPMNTGSGSTAKDVQGIITTVWANTANITNSTSSTGTDDNSRTKETKALVWAPDVMKKVTMLIPLVLSISLGLAIGLFLCLKCCCSNAGGKDEHEMMEIGQVLPANNRSPHLNGNGSIRGRARDGHSLPNQSPLNEAHGHSQNAQPVATASAPRLHRPGNASRGARHTSRSQAAISNDSEAATGTTSWSAPRKWWGKLWTPNSVAFNSRQASSHDVETSVESIQPENQLLETSNQENSPDHSQGPWNTTYVLREATNQLAKFVGRDSFISRRSQRQRSELEYENHRTASGNNVTDPNAGGRETMRSRRKGMRDSWLNDLFVHQAPGTEHGHTLGHPGAASITPLRQTTSYYFRNEGTEGTEVDTENSGPSDNALALRRISGSMRAFHQSPERLRASEEIETASLSTVRPEINNGEAFYTITARPNFREFLDGQVSRTPSIGLIESKAWGDSPLSSTDTAHRSHKGAIILVSDPKLKNNGASDRPPLLSRNHSKEQAHMVLGVDDHPSSREPFTAEHIGPSEEEFESQSSESRIDATSFSSPPIEEVAPTTNSTFSSPGTLSRTRPMPGSFPNSSQYRSFHSLESLSNGYPDHRTSNSSEGNVDSYSGSPGNGSVCHHSDTEPAIHIFNCSDTQEDNVEIRSIGYHQLIRHGEFVAYPSPTYNTNEPIMSHFSGPRKDIRRCQSMTNGNARHGEVVKYNGNVGNYDGSRSDGWITDSGTEDDYEIAWRKRAMTSTERENKRRMIEATEIAAVLEARGRELRDRERRAGFVRF